MGQAVSGVNKLVPVYCCLFRHVDQSEYELALLILRVLERPSHAGIFLVREPLLVCLTRDKRTSGAPQ